MKNYLFVIIFLLSSNAFSDEYKISYVLRDVESGKIVASKNQETPMILASVSKLFSSYFVLKNLDQNFQYETNLFYDGTNLYLKGSGDPYLTAQDLISLIFQLKRKGINRIDGKFILDDSALSFTNRISKLGTIDQADNSSIGALNAEFNRLKYYRGTKAFFPPLENVTLKLKNKKNFGQKFNIANGKDQYWIGFLKDIKKRKEEIPSLDSTMFTGYYLKYLSRIHGVVLPRPVKGLVSKKAKKIATHQGLPLRRLVSLGLEYSNNIIAETLLKTAIKNKTSFIYSEKKAAVYLKNWLKENYQSKFIDDLSLENGSGITLNNLSSARYMTDFLRHVYLKDELERSFISYLSINGHSGGLQKFLQSPELAFRVYGKTGSLFYINNLAGYLVSKSGKLYSYAIFMKHNKRDKVNNNLNSKQEKLRKESKSWYRLSNKVIEELLIKWQSN